MDNVNFNGQKIPIAGTITANNATYVIRLAGTLCWYPGRGWHEFRTTAMGDSEMSFAETKSALQSLAQDDWSEHEGDIICSARDFHTVHAWGKIEFKNG